MKVEKVLRRLGYDVLANIGEGGFGEVKLAKSTKHGDKVAIKVMDRKIMPPAVVKEYLPQELAILKTVKHQHIVQVHDIHCIRKRLIFIVMEVAAMDLSDKMSELGQIPTHLARLWFSQLISAMVYLHGRDIAHRDLKCDNILLTADGQVKLTDFGFGCFFNDELSKLRSTMCGTLVYMAPEVLKSEPYDPKKSDVWSLGVILYVMITGCMPFPAETQRKLRRLYRKPLRFPEGVTVDEPCRDLITSMLCYDPTGRPSVAQVAEHPWLKTREEEEEQQVEEGSTVEYQPVDPEPVDGSGGAGVEAIEVEVEEVEEFGCVGCGFGSAVKRVLKAFVVEPIIRSSWALRRKIRKIFRKKSSASSSSSDPQQGAHHPQDPTEAPAAEDDLPRRPGPVCITAPGGKAGAEISQI